MICWRARQQFGVDELVAERGCDRAAVFEGGVMVDPLPELRAADFGGGGVFHQVEERNAADAAQPRFDIAEADGDVLLQAGFGDGAGGDCEQIGGGAGEVGELLVRFDLAAA